MANSSPNVIPTPSVLVMEDDKNVPEIKQETIEHVQDPLAFSNPGPSLIKTEPNISSECVQNPNSIDDFESIFVKQEPI